jgi:hypothetical protein
MAFYFTPARKFVISWWNTVILVPETSNDNNRHQQKLRNLKKSQSHNELPFVYLYDLKLVESIIFSFILPRLRIHIRTIMCPTYSL